MTVLLIGPSRFYSGDWGPGSNGHLFVLYSHLRAACPDTNVQVLDLEHEIGRPDTDAQVESFLAMAARALDAIDFDIVAISCWTSLHYLSTVAIARLCRQTRPGCTIVVGGYHPSAVPDDFDPALFDVIVQGEGEIALTRVCQGEKLQGVVKGERLPSLDMTLLWDEFPYFRAARHVPMWFSRGCPFLCTFCHDRATGWRALPPERAVAEIARVKRLLPGVDTIDLLDPLFAANRRWRREFLAALDRLDPDLGFWAETRADTLDPQDAESIGRHRFRLDIGLDAVSPPLIRRMGKSARPDRYLAAFDAVDSALELHRVPHSVYLLLNHPGETLGMLDETVSWATNYYRDARDHWGLLSAQSYKFFPGSQLARDLDGGSIQGVHIHHPDWWRTPRAPHHALAARVVSSRDKAASARASAHVDAMQAINALARTRVVPDALPTEAAETRPLLAADRHFAGRSVRLSPDAAASQREDGRVIVHHLERLTSRLCSAEVSRWISGDRPAPPAEGTEAVRLYAGGFISVEVPPPSDSSPSAHSARIVTDLGTIGIDLLPDAAPRTVALFAHLARLGIYDSTRVDRSCPGLFAWMGLLDWHAATPFTLPREPGRLPVVRGALLMDIGTHTTHFAIARGDWPEAEQQSTVFGQVTSGWEVLDRLVTYDIVQRVEILPSP